MSLYTRKSRTPTLAKALVISAIGKDYTLEPYHPVPIPGPGEVLIRCVAVSLNPVDWQSKAYNFGIPHLPWINGRDASGIIERIGEDVTNFHIGDPVFTLTDYTKSHAGSYQEFFVASAISVARILPGLSFKDAAAVLVAAVSAAVSLQRYMGVGLESQRQEWVQGQGMDGGSERRWLSVWGGATSSGYMVIQLAKIYGLCVIAVASPRNFGYLRDAGADVILDRNHPEEALRQIQDLTRGRLTAAFDAVGPSTARLCAKALVKDTLEPSVLVALAGLPKGAAEDQDFASLSLLLVKVKLFHNEPEYGVRLLEELTTYLADGKVKPPRISVLTGGFDAVNVGLKRFEKYGDFGEEAGYSG